MQSSAGTSDLLSSVLIFFLIPFQLQEYSQSTLFVPSFASTLTERLERLKNHFHSFPKHSAVSRATSSLPSNNVYSLKSSKEYYQLIENSKRCIVGLETTFRDGLELNTTYLIGQTLEGETMLFPKQMLEQGNVIPISETDLIEEVEETPSPPPTPAPSEPTFEMSKTPYACRGNLVTCVTGSFDWSIDLVLYITERKRKTEQQLIKKRKRSFVFTFPDFRSGGRKATTSMLVTPVLEMSVIRRFFLFGRPPRTASSFLLIHISFFSHSKPKEKKRKKRLWCSARLGKGKSRALTAGKNEKKKKKKKENKRGGKARLAFPPLTRGKREKEKRAEAKREKTGE